MTLFTTNSKTMWISWMHKQLEISPHFAIRVQMSWQCREKKKKHLLSWVFFFKYCTSSTMTKQSAGRASVQCHVSKQSRSPGQSWCSLARQRREICPVSILARPLVAASLTSKLQVQCDSARTLVWSTQETHQQVPHERCFLTFAPVCGAFLNQRAAGF